MRVKAIMLVIILIWGINTPVMKIGLMNLNPFVYNAFRLASGAFLSILALFISKQYRPMAVHDVKILFSISVFGFFLNQLFVVLGLSLTTAGNAALIFATLPVEIALMNHLFRIEPVSKKMAVGIIAGLLGVFLIVWGSDKELSLSGPHLIGALFLLVGQTCYGYYTVFFCKLTNNYSIYQVLACVLTISATLFAAVAWQDINKISWVDIPTATWCSVLFSAVLALSFANLVWIWAVGIMGSTKAALYQYLCPIISIFFAWVYLDESFSWFQLFGAIVTFIGLYLTRHRPPPA